MNIDCQIWGKSDMYEALSTMCEIDIMQGDNKVFCDKCKKSAIQYYELLFRNYQMY